MSEALKLPENREEQEVMGSPEGSLDLDNSEELNEPIISNKQMVQATRRLEDRVRVVQIFSRKQAKLANTFCFECRSFLRLKTHCCENTVMHQETMKKFGGLPLLRKRFITKCLNEVREMRTFYQKAMEFDILEGRELDAQVEESPGIGAVYEEIDQRDLSSCVLALDKHPLDETVKQYWEAKSDIQEYIEPYPMQTIGRAWICFDCFKIHEETDLDCRFGFDLSSQDKVAYKAQKELDSRITGEFISQYERVNCFYQFAKRRYYYYRNLLKEDVIQNPRNYAGFDDDIYFSRTVEMKEDKLTGLLPSQYFKEERIKKPCGSSFKTIEKKKSRYGINDAEVLSEKSEREDCVSDA